MSALLIDCFVSLMSISTILVVAIVLILTFDITLVIADKLIRLFRGRR